jgi:hypothetical protein
MDSISMSRNTVAAGHPLHYGYSNHPPPTFPLALSIHARKKNSSQLTPPQSCLHLQRKHPSDHNEDIFFFSKTRILVLAKLIAVLISVVLLLLPVFLLAVVPMQRKVATTLVLIFVLAFAFFLSLLMGENAKAVFVASCA